MSISIPTNYALASIISNLIKTIMLETLRRDFSLKQFEIRCSHIKYQTKIWVQNLLDQYQMQHIDIDLKFIPGMSPA